MSFRSLHGPDTSGNYEKVHDQNPEIITKYCVKRDTTTKPDYSERCRVGLSTFEWQPWFNIYVRVMKPPCLCQFFCQLKKVPGLPFNSIYC